jgi:hypothetical protein
MIVKIKILANLTALSLIGTFYPTVAEALATPLGSSFMLEARSDAGGAIVTDIDSDSQFGTLNPLNASVSALATSGNASVLSTAQGTATWINSSQGQVNLFNIGWDTVGVSFGDSSLDIGSDWTYEFIADTTGLFTLSYDITGSGSDEFEPNTFGLNGFYFNWSGAEGTEFLNLNTSATLTRAVTAGSTYTVNIQNVANIGGGLGTRNAHMDGVFNWEIGAASVPESIPEPRSVVGLALVGLGVFLKKKLTSSRVNG